MPIGGIDGVPISLTGRRQFGWQVRVLLPNYAAVMDNFFKRSRRDQLPGGPIAFDGSNLWLSAIGPNSAVLNAITEVRASDGQTIGTFATGSNPTDFLFAAGHIWVANLGSNTVSKF